MNGAPRRLALLMVLGTAGLFAPGVAEAASVSFDRACYRGPMQQNVSVTGLAAESNFALWQQDPIIYPEFGFLGDFDTDASGNASTTRSVVALDESGPQEAVATLAVRSGETEVATGQYRFTALSARPEIVGYEKTTGSINLDVHGFIEGGTLFAHYSYKGKHFKTIAVGPLQGPCGSLQKKIAKFPFRPVKKGEWWIQFDNRRTYQRQQPPFVEHLTSVAKTVAKKPKKCKRGKRCPRR